MDYISKFDIKTYENEISHFASDENAEEQGSTGKIESAEDAALNAQRAWITLFEEETIYEQRPFSVFYDEDTDMWLVRGSYDSLEDTPDVDTYGGAAHAIIVGKDGRVVAFWHTS